MKIKRIILMAALIISVASVQAQKSQVIAHRGYWKTANPCHGEKDGTGRSYGIYHFLAARNERVYPSGTCRNLGILPQRRTISQRTERPRRCRT